MHIRNFNLILMLIAGIIVTIISIISGHELNRLMYTLMIVLVLFFFLGTIIQSLLNNIAERADVNAREREKALLDQEANNLVEETKETDEEVDIEEP